MEEAQARGKDLNSFNPRLAKMWYIFILFSLFIHLLFFSGLFFFQDFSFAPEATHASVTWIENQDIQTNLIDLPQNTNQQKPKKAKFVSSQSNSTNQETVVAKKNPQANLTEVTTPNQAKQQKSQTKIASNTQQNTFTQNLNSQLKSYTPPVTQEKLGTKSQQWDRFSHDYYPSIKVGEKTWVNAYGLPEASYFTMLKRVFRLRFNPSPALRAYYSTHPIDARQIQTTILVVLSQNGTLKQLSISRSSGIAGHDQEVLQTVKESSPFTSPPAKFLYQGELSMKWTFITYIL